MTIFSTGNPEYKIDSPVFVEQFNDKFNITLDTLLPSNVEHIIDLINKKEVAKTVVSFEVKHKTMLEQKNFWNGTTIENIKIPIGYVNPKQIQYLDFGKKTNDYFGLIGGLSGMGKTVLLHNIILWGAMEYSPFELRTIIWLTVKMVQDLTLIRICHTPKFCRWPMTENLV